MPGPVDVPIRPAATVMVVRDSPTGADSRLEVLMVRRNLRADFVGGAYVFPGGAVDPDDGGPAAEALCAGRDDAGASVLLGVPSGGLGYWVAAVRETFEEAAILLASSQSGASAVGDDASGAAGRAARATRLEVARSELNARRRGFLDICRQEHLLLDVGAVHYFAHWIAPLGAPRRYDTRFFVAPAPPGQVAKATSSGADGGATESGETVDQVWIAPADALARHRAGEIQIVVPTVRNLQAISRFATSAALLEVAAAAAAVPAVEPRLVADGNGVRIVLPGDAGGTAPDGGADGTPVPTVEEFNEAMRIASLRANREGAGGG